MSAVFKLMAGGSLVGGGLVSLAQTQPIPCLIVCGVFLSLSGFFEMTRKAKP